MSTYNSVWEQHVDEILQQIVHDMIGTTIFPKENVTYGFWKNWSYNEYPNCQVSFVRDRVTDATRDEEHHYFTFEVKATIQGTGKPEEDQDTQIDVIGQIYDAIRTDNTLGGYANWVVVRNVDVTFRRSESLIFYDFLVTLEVLYVW